MSCLRFILVVAALAVVNSGCGSSTARNDKTDASPLADLDYPVGAFSLIERDGRTVTERDLLGKVWVASFVFTRCMGNCPAVTASVRELQGKIPDPNVMFVTFTVTGGIEEIRRPLPGRPSALAVPDRRRADHSPITARPVQAKRRRSAKREALRDRRPLLPQHEADCRGQEGHDPGNVRWHAQRKLPRGRGALRG
jgi:hypothetical protein